MKRILGAAFATALVTTHAAPVPPGDLALRNTINLAGDMGITPNSMFNPRYFDGDVYVNQINTPGFGRYASGSAIPELLGYSAVEHRMVAPFRGANAEAYIFGASGAATTTFSRYDFDGLNQVDVEVPGGGQTSEGFDWVDEDTIVYTTYNPSANRKRISLATVVAEPFSVTPDTTWNANGYVNTSVSTRIRNVRVGDAYSGYAYYGDAGQNSNPNFYALNLATGEETLLGNAGTLTGGGSFGVWTVMERDGYLYVQTTDNGVHVYEMESATELGDLHTTYSKERLDELTGYMGQYYGFDVSADGEKMLLGAAQGLVYELAPALPLTRRTTFDFAADAGLTGNSIFNPRIFDGDVYVNQVNSPTGFGRYPLGESVPSLVVYGELEHRMVAPFRGEHATSYIMGASGAVFGTADTTKTFSRYDFDGLNRVDAVVPGDQTSEGFDWVDEDTIIYTSYSPSANRKRLSLATVVAEPFSVIADTTWNANGYVTTSVSTRIRNVRVGDVYSGYAYYGDAGQNNNPNFYAINLGTGEETLLGNAGQLTGGGSFGIWTVIERGGKLYVQTTDNGIQVYEMASATSLGALQTTYTKEDLDTATGYTGQYWGLDVLADGRTFVVGDAQGRAHELAVLVVESIELEIERSGGNVVISWPESVEGAVLQASSSVSAGGFEDMDPQPAVVAENGRLSVTLPVDEEMQFFRLRK